MRISTRLVSTAILLLLCNRFIYAQSEAGNYLNSINTEFIKISQDMMSYVSAANHGRSARKVEKRRQELIMQTKDSELAIRKLRPFNGSSSLRDSTVAYFRISNLVIKEDYDKILNLEEIAEQSYDLMEAYLLMKEKASEKIHLAFQAASREYQAFAKANNIKLIDSDSKLSQRLKEASEVNDYHNKVYLLFFKSYKNEAYLLDALNRGDINALEQTRNALTTSAEEDLRTLGAVQPFQGDGALKKATQDILSFYRSEAVNKVPTLTSMLLAKEQYEKARKAFESKREADRTQADIDTYNKTVDEFNKQVQMSNVVNEELNKKRSQFLKAWNDTSEAFLHRHTPR